jgi:hypothetical protein
MKKDGAPERAPPAFVSVRLAGYFMVMRGAPAPFTSPICRI